MSTMTYKIHMARRDRGRLELVEGEKPAGPVFGEVPTRIARLVGLAHHIESLVRAGKLRDYAEAATLGGITRARATQIVNLLMLAPDIQEHLLTLRRPLTGREAIGERDIRPIVAVMDWKKQREMFAALVAERSARMPAAGKALV